MTKEHTFRAGFIACGLGAGALGFMRSMASLGKNDKARFVNVGGVDIDAAACEDFRRITGGPALEADLHTLTPEQLRAFMGEEAPDVVFFSMPCKGMSGLISNDLAKTQKYQDLNSLVFKAFFLVCETWKGRIPMLVFENVPRIKSRGAALLAQVRQLLTGYGMVINEETHECAEIGGLGARRRRYLLMARLPALLPEYVHRTPRQRIKACGEVLGTLPLPETASAGPLHRLPKLSAINWLRLALIPAGGDWRDLPKKGEGIRFGHVDKVTRWDETAGTITHSPAPSSGALAVADPRIEFQRLRAAADRIGLAETADNAGSFKGRPGLMGVNDWEQPARTVNGTMKVTGGNSFASVADPRVEAPPGVTRAGSYGVTSWDEPAKTITGESYPSNGGASVADPRVALDHEPRRGSMGVTAWEEPAPTIRGHMEMRQAPAAVADPRLALDLGAGAHNNLYRVGAWEEPAGTVTGATRPGGGAPSVADPRVLPPELLTPLEDGQARRSLFKRWHINAWTEPTGVVAGEGGNNGAYGVADPMERVPMKCTPRAGAYGVISWQEAAHTITGAAQVDNGPFAVAEPRFAGMKLINDKYPIIISADGTWHRPLTTLELAVLQGLPPTYDDGTPLVLAGRSMSSKRERIGNAVPVGAAQAVGESILTALLASKLGTWSLSSEGIWVENESGKTEYEFAYLGDAA